jgi:hypothetical protein
VQLKKSTSPCLISVSLKIKSKQTIISSVVFNGCETLSVQEKSSLRMFENIMIRSISEPKRDEVIIWRGTLWSTQVYTRGENKESGWLGYLALMSRQTYIQNVGVKTSWKQPLVAPRSGWEGKIKRNIKNLDCEDGKWVELVQDCIPWRALVLAVSLQAPLSER